MASQPVAGPVLTGTGRFRFDVRWEPRDIIARDLNEDGLPDLVTLTSFGTVAVMLSSTTRGSFLASPRQYRLFPFDDYGSDADSSAAIEDFNGDGHWDLAVASGADDAIVVYPGRGDGNLDNRHVFPTPRHPWIMGAADLDGDGYGDLVVQIGDVVTVLRGRADATFHPGISSPLGSRAHSAVLADFNSDGSPDLVTFADRDLMVSLSNSDGTFAAGLVHPMEHVRGGLAVDLDHDGNVDLVTGHFYLSHFFLPGRGDGTFDPARTIPAGIAGDFDGNGNLDFLTFNPLGPRMELGNGDGTFQAPLIVAWDGLLPQYDAVVDDFDGDGRQDIASGGAHSSVTIVLGNGDGTFDRNVFVPVGDRPWGIESADFNGDGLDDLVTANADSHDLTILLSQADGTFMSTSIETTLPTPYSVATGDLDGDGRLDLLVGETFGYEVFLGNDDGTFRASQTIVQSDSSWSSELGDIDGNGSLDFVGLYGHLDQVRIFRNNGDGTFDAGQTVPVGDVPRALVVADFDEDGRDDIAASNDGSDSLTLILRNGTQIGTRRLATDASNGQALITSDFNEDGHLDLFADQGSLSLFLGNGDGTFGFGNWIETEFPGFAIPGDFNSDGHADVLARGWHDLAVLFGLGDGRFEGMLAFGSGPSQISITTGDFDGDGRTDVATANTDQDAVAILMNRINRAPFADAGVSRLEECRTPHGTLVTLDARASNDPDGDQVTFAWNSMGASFLNPTSAVTEGIFPLGRSQVTLVVDDGERRDEAIIDVHVRDSMAPIVSASLEQAGGGRGERKSNQGSNSDAGSRRANKTRLEVRFDAVDSCDATLAVAAELQLGLCGSLPVENGQLLTFRQADRCSVETKHGALKIEAPSLVLHVDATDDSGNSATVTEALEEAPNGRRAPSQLR